MTKLLEDIVREPGELAKVWGYGFGPGRQTLDEAARILRDAAVVFIVGMGSSWNAGCAVLNAFQEQGRTAILVDASELLHFGKVASGAAVIVLSRSGKSAEIVKLIPELRARNCRLIAITNTPGSPLALGADVTVLLDAVFDHQVSVTMYSALALVGCALARLSTGSLDQSIAPELTVALAESTRAFSVWQEKLAKTSWLNPASPTYFLGRGSGLASCHEARLLWEEAAKVPASAMPTGGFRHGPQEMIREGVRIAMWIDGQRMRREDLALARDLREYGAVVLLIGQELPEDAADVVLNLPRISPEWQFVLEIIPIQLAAERLSHLNSEDCDAFRLCSYIVEDEGGLSPKNADRAKTRRVPQK